MAMFTFSVSDWNYPFWKNLVKKIKIVNFGTYNHFHNILRLFDALQNVPFATSETMGNYYL